MWILLILDSTHVYIFLHIFLNRNITISPNICSCLLIFSSSNLTDVLLKSIEQTIFSRTETKLLDYPNNEFVINSNI